MLPKLTIDGVSSDILADLDLEEAGGDFNKIRDLEKHHIITKISDKNPQIKQLQDLGHTCNVIYFRKNKRIRNGNECEEITLGLKVSPLIHSTIFSIMNASLYLGNRRYQVKDRFYITKCYHCQEIGHTSSSCPDAAKLPVCFYCADRHRSAVCMKKSHKDAHQCARCITSTNRTDNESAKTHNAESLECPAMVRAMSRMASNTDFTSKNVM